MIDFLIFYEVVPREIENIVLLGNELKRRGYTVEYLSFEHVNLKKYLQNKKYIKKYFNNVKFAVMPSLYHDKELYSIVYYVCGKCTQVVNLRWEQSFTNKTEHDYDSYQYPHGDACIAYHLCWGKASFDNMVAAGIAEDKLLLTGPIHMDLLRKEFRGYYFDRENLFSEFSLPNDRKTILFISSFAISSRTERQIKAEEKAAGSTLFVNDSVLRTRESYIQVLNWIEGFLKDNDVTFIYRPHPAENVLGELHRLEEQYGNFHVIPDYSVKQWIITCDIVTTWVSTSVAETFFAQKPCKIIQPIPIPEDDRMTIYEDATVVTSKDEYLKTALDEGKTSVSEKIIRYYYDVNDVPSFIRLSNALQKIYFDDRNAFPWDDRKIKDFNWEKWKYVIQSILIYPYVPLLDFFGRLRKKTKISFGKKINSRMDSYQVAKLKFHTKFISQSEIDKISKRLCKLHLEEK